MSIVLKDGTVLPDIPSDYWEKLSSEYPYYLILGNPGADDEYVAQFIPTKSVYVPAEYSGLSIGMVMSSEGALGTWSYMTGPEINYNWAAGLLGGEDFIFSTLSYSQTEEPVILYANHDILTATAVDTSTGTITVGDEVYFPNSEAKPPFILPDGTELPALPEGCFEKYPYGVIAKINGSNATSYALYASSSEEKYETAEDSGIGVTALSAKTNGYIIYILEDVTSDWVADGPYEDEVCMVPLGEVGAGTESVLFALVWCNHDVLVSADGTLYRKSDVNYRIYGGWLNSMGNQARRLGGVSGELKPGEMESVFSGATLEPLTVTPTTEEQTFTPESPCIGFSSVTVEAAPDTGGGDSGETEEPEELPSADDLSFNMAEQSVCLTSAASYGTASCVYYQGVGYQFYVKESVILSGVKYYLPAGGSVAIRINLWENSTDTIIASIDIPATTAGGSWAFASWAPIQLTASTNYTVQIIRNDGKSSNFTYSTMTSPVFGCFSSIEGRKGASGGRPKTYQSYIAAIDFTIGQSFVDVTGDMYAIEYTDLEQLAYQVYRITSIGTTTVKEAIAALQTVPAMTT